VSESAAKSAPSSNSNPNPAHRRSLLASAREGRAPDVPVSLCLFGGGIGGTATACMSCSVCVCVCACVRACVRAYVRVCACAQARQARGYVRYHEAPLRHRPRLWHAAGVQALATHTHPWTHTHMHTGVWGAGTPLPSCVRMVWRVCVSCVAMVGTHG
jgi:hypothetical protein